MAKTTKTNDFEKRASEFGNTVEAPRPDGALDLAVGDAAIVEMVGSPQESRRFAGKRFRVVKVIASSTGEYDEGATLYLNGSAKLNQLGVLDFKPGTVCLIRRLPDVETSNANPMKDYEVRVGDLPF